jgi:hypothetical protein
MYHQPVSRLWHAASATAERASSWGAASSLSKRSIVTNYPPPPAHPQQAPQYPPPYSEPAPGRSFLVTWLLAMFLGIFGADRFYLGKIGTGALKLVTLGGLGVWALVDLFLVLSGAQRDKDRRPLEGYQQHKKTAWLVTGGLFLLSFAFSALGGDDDAPEVATVQSAVADPAPAEEEAAADEEAAAEEAAAEEAAAEEAAAEEAAAEEAAAAEAAAPGVGDTVEVGDFEITITGLETGVTSVGDSFMAESPQGQFVIVRLTVSNTGTSAEYFFDSDQELIDEQDRQHSTSSNSFLMDEENLWLTEINPGNTVEGALLYDIPADAEPVAIDVESGWFSDPVRIALD